MLPHRAWSPRWRGRWELPAKTRPGLPPIGKPPWPWGRTQWTLSHIIPCFAWPGWLALAARTQKASHFLFAFVYLLPFLLLVAFTEGFDYISDDEEELMIFGTLVFPFWVAALIHGHKAWPKIAALNEAAQARQG